MSAQVLTLKVTGEKRRNSVAGRLCCIRCCTNNDNGRCEAIRGGRANTQPCAQFGQNHGVTYTTCSTCVGGCAVGVAG